MIGSTIVNSVYAQEIGWNSLHQIELSYGTLMGNSNSHISLSVISFGGSPYKSVPYARIGFGSAIVEYNQPGDRSRGRGSWLPLYFHVIPYMRLEQWLAQPIERIERGAFDIKYYYYPSKATEVPFARKLIDIYIGGSAWSYNPDDDVNFFGNRWYIKSGIKMMYFVKLSESIMLTIDSMPIGIDIGTMVTPIENNNVKTFFYFAITMGFGSYHGRE